MKNQFHEEDWAIYLTNIHDNHLGSVLVDLGLNSVAPVPSFSTLLTFITYFNQPNEDGLTSNSEDEIINQIEDEIINSLITNYTIVYAGRIKFSGKMHSYFYFENKQNVEDKIEELNSKYSNYRFEYTIGDDSDWTAYFEVLYPSEFEMQIIQNGKVIENLREHGDLLVKERPVDHWIYFQNFNDRGDFLNWIKDLGFEVVEQNEIGSDELSFSLQLSRIDKVDYENVNDYVLFLWQKAQEFRGEYDGWETVVVKE